MGQNVESVWNQHFFSLTSLPPPLPPPEKEYVLYTRLNICSYEWSLNDVKITNSL